jgi:hypothetical protein
MDEVIPEKAKADRHLRIILILMAVGTVLPLVLLYFCR